MVKPLDVPKGTIRRGSVRIGSSILIFLCILFFPAQGLHTAQVPAAAKAFSFETVVEEARALAARPYAEPGKLRPERLLRITYDQWRDIRFKPEKSLWRREHLPFQVQFFHPGFLYDRVVEVSVVDRGRATPLTIDSSLFNYGANAFREEGPTIVGAAGFRVHTLLNTADYFDEFLVFLGASYFRAVAKGQYYGLSARGIAVDTAMPKGEEFPWFRRFWIAKPRPGEKEVTVYALLDSHSLSGAYAFTIRPGEETTVSVKSVLFLRQTGIKLGIAPLTSMFMFGENTSPRPFMDYRPEVHDSDGLQIAFSSGEWLFRPLSNPQTLVVNKFQAPAVKGFGLVQRDVRFESYEDLETRYDRRPSVWIEPRGSWGPGHVELVQIPTPNEINDNIVAYWIPDTLPEPLQPMHFDYDMRWTSADSIKGPAGIVVATRQSRGRTERHRAFVLDFEGKALSQLNEHAPLEAVVTVGEGAVLSEHQLFKNPVTGGWRLAFQIFVDEQSALDKVLPNTKPPVELRAFLKNGRDVLSETWSYSVKP
jgi:periplasmic glucans biosynthesis protein